jgi:hypothetical protein
MCVNRFAVGSGEKSDRSEWPGIDELAFPRQDACITSASQTYPFLSVSAVATFFKPVSQKNNEKFDIT